MYSLFTLHISALLKTAFEKAAEDINVFFSLANMSLAQQMAHQFPRTHAHVLLGAFFPIKGLSSEWHNLRLHFLHVFLGESDEWCQ